MSFKYLFIASAVLIAFCGADVSEIKAEKVDLPFNDLLPPLLDESSTTTTTTTVRPATALDTKPTKKSYYQKPAQVAKEETKPKSGADKPEVQQLALDLLPPFKDDVKQAEEKPQVVVKEVQQLALDLLPPFKDDAKPEEKPQVVVKTTTKPVVSVTQRPVPKVIHSAVPKVSHQTVPVVHLQAAPSHPQYSVQPAPAPSPQYTVHPAPQPSPAPALGSGFQSRFSNYFLSSTVRPRRGPLPTITPFPRIVRL